MASVNKLFVCGTVVFTIYFMGGLDIIMKLASDMLLPDLGSIVTIKEVPDPVADPASNPFIAETQGIYNKLQKTIDKKKNEMGEFMKKVVSTMEELVKDVDVDSLNEEEKWDTLTELYEKFPVMEKVFEKALAMESTLGNDPTQHKDTQKRLASVKKILEDSKETIVKKIKEKGTGHVPIDQDIQEQDHSYQFEEEENTLNEVSSETESENNISEPESIISKNINENEDHFKRINVNQNENVHTEL